MARGRPISHARRLRAPSASSSMGRLGADGVRHTRARVAAAGEPFQLFLDPAELAEFLEKLGFNDKEDLTRDGINTRYALKLRGKAHLIRSGSR